MTDFDDYQAETAPPWMGGENAELWSRILGLGKQGVIQAAKAAVKSGLARLAPPDALPEIATTFGLDVGFREVAGALRTRILGAWGTWEIAGTRTGLVRAFADAGLTATVIGRNESSALGWWQFDLRIDPPFPWEGLAPEDVPQEWRAFARALVKKWKPTHAECRRLSVNCYGETWAQRQTRRVTWDALPQEPWTGRQLVIAEGIL